MKKTLILIFCAFTMSSLAQAGVLDRVKTTAGAIPSNAGILYELKPDLIVVGLSFGGKEFCDQCSDSRRDAGVSKSSCDFVIRIKNKGGKTGPFYVGLSYTAAVGLKTYRIKHIAQGLKAGESKVVKMGNDFVGWYKVDEKFTAKVDFKREIKESNEINNSFSKTL